VYTEISPSTINKNFRIFILFKVQTTIEIVMLDISFQFLGDMLSIQFQELDQELGFLLETLITNEMDYKLRVCCERESSSRNS
jgi:hypothetical protein